MLSLSSRHARDVGHVQRSTWGRGAAAGLLAASMLLLLSPSLSRAAVVKGKVSGIQKLSNPVWNEAKEPSANRYTWREPSPTVRAEFRQLFPYAPKEICVAALGAAPVTPGNAAIAFKIGGGRTTPVTLVVAPGTTLEFQNRDPFPHRPYVVGNPSFQAADMKGASARQWKVPGPGKYEIRDELAPSVRSWIVAEPNLVSVAFPTREGAFQFANLPPGEYTLRGYFGGQAVGKPVAVKVASEAPLEVKEVVTLLEDTPAGGKK
jgi:plastocyanin